MKLRYYRKKIELDKSAIYVLCQCVSTIDARKLFWKEAVSPAMLKYHLNICRMILATKYGEQQLPTKIVKNNEADHSNLNEVDRSVVSARIPVMFA